MVQQLWSEEEAEIILFITGDFGEKNQGDIRFWKQQRKAALCQDLQAEMSGRGRTTLDIMENPQTQGSD